MSEQKLAEVINLAEWKVKKGIKIFRLIAEASTTLEKQQIYDKLVVNNGSMPRVIKATPKNNDGPKTD